MQRKYISKKYKTYIIREGINMAKKIEIGLELTGQDAKDFIEYMKNPQYSDEIIQCMTNALQKNRA